MKLASPHQAYSILWHALTGRHTSPARAAQLLERRFSTTSSRRACTVLVVDELDYLVTRKQTVRVSREGTVLSFNQAPFGNTLSLLFLIFRTRAGVVQLVRVAHKKERKADRSGHRKHNGSPGATASQGMHATRQPAALVRAQLCNPQLCVKADRVARAACDRIATRFTPGLEWDGLCLRHIGKSKSRPSSRADWKAWTHSWIWRLKSRRERSPRGLEMFDGPCRFVGARSRPRTHLPPRARRYLGCVLTAARRFCAVCSLFSIAAEAALNEAEEKGTTLRPVTIQDINRASEDMRNSRHMVVRRPTDATMYVASFTRARAVAHTWCCCLHPSQAIAQAPDWQRVFLVALFLHLQSSGTDTVPFPSVRARWLRR